MHSHSASRLCRVQRKQRMSELNGSCIKQWCTDLVVHTETHTEFISWRVSFRCNSELHDRASGSCMYPLYDSDTIVTEDRKHFTPVRYTDTGVLVRCDDTGAESVISVDQVASGNFEVYDHLKPKGAPIP